MKNIIRINRNLFNIYALFTRIPFVKTYTEEIEFYISKDRCLLGFISIDMTDNDYYATILSRNKSKQFQGENMNSCIETLGEARKWIEVEMNKDSITKNEDSSGHFDLFDIKAKKTQLHPHFKYLNENVSYRSAKEVIQEISYHYKDIDGNFIDQFQSLNGFDARIWELYLFCLFREELFSFKRNSHAPDYIIEKFGKEVAIEAVIVARDKNNPPNNNLKINSPEEIQKSLKNEMPLRFGSALFDKLKKKYWDLPEVQGKPFVIAIADFHADMSMTWSSSAINEYLYGRKDSFHYDEKGDLIIEPQRIEEYTKKSGAKIPAGFFFQPGTEDVSAIIFSATATLSKYNRMGKQAGLGSPNVNIFRSGECFDHNKNASKPLQYGWIVDENTNEKWSEGVSIFHNPNAKIPLDKSLFPSVAHHEFRDGFLYSDNPDFHPYNSMNHVTVITS